MGQGEALEHFVHTFDLGESVVVDTPVRKRNLQERAGEFHVIGIHAHIRGIEGVHQHIL